MTTLTTNTNTEIISLPKTAIDVASHRQSVEWFAPGIGCEHYCTGSRFFKFLFGHGMDLHVVEMVDGVPHEIGTFNRFMVALEFVRELVDADAIRELRKHELRMWHDIFA